MEHFKTQSRALEQFFFAHRVYFESQQIGQDGMNTWIYPRDAYLEHLLDEWSIVTKRKRMVRSEKILGDSVWHGKRQQTPW